MTRSGFAVPDTTLSERRRWVLAGLPLTRTQYLLSEDTLERRCGIVSPVKTTVALSHIRRVAATQTHWQRLWGLSTVRVATDDPVVSELVICNIRNGALFEERLRRYAEEAQSVQPHTV